MELRQLRYFVAVAEELHFGRAATRLMITGPTLSQQVAALERELKVRLFDRDSRHVALTPAGAVLLDHGRALLAAAERARILTREAGAASPQGRVGLCYSPAAGYLVVPLLLGAMRDAHPQIDVTAVEMWGPYLLAAVSRGDYDIGIASAPQRVPDLRYRPVAAEPLAVVLAADHPLAARDTVPVAALAAQRILLWPRELAPGFYDLVVDMCRAAGFEPTIARYQHVGGRDLREFADGLGVGVSVASNAAVATPGTCWRPLADAPALTYQLCWRDEPSPAAVRFIDLAATLDTIPGRRGARHPVADAPGA